MGWRSNDYGWFPRTPTVGERRAKAERAARKLARKQDLDPVVIDGALAATWWGKAWNRNLEGYSDYSNRLPRGRSYARNGLVIDLRLEPGSVKALVQGSRSTPYEVSIDITRMTPAARKQLVADCAGRLDSAEALLAGRFPEDLGRMLTSERSGLFPSPRGIKFSCSCPDWASMCKHVAATLYGVGSRLDRDASLFFRLREVPLAALVSEAVDRETRKILKGDGTGESARLKLESDGLESLFGVELAVAGAPTPLPEAAGITAPVSPPPIPPPHLPKRGRGRPKGRKVEKTRMTVITPIPERKGPGGPLGKGSKNMQPRGKKTAQSRVGKRIDRALKGLLDHLEKLKVEVRGL